jgi:D-serine deaminase-like pyridoxal phosphate-dependent protein
MIGICEDTLMHCRLESYRLKRPQEIITPALLIYPELVDANIQATLRMIGGDPDRWRPHIKTAKVASIIHRLIAHGIRNFKSSTTLELLTACQAGAADVLLAFPVGGANAKRLIDIAKNFPNTRVSVLADSLPQANAWQGTGIGIFLDVNSGMNRTGIDQTRTEDVVALARRIGSSFRGLHYYDGHIGGYDLNERTVSAHRGYEQLMVLVHALENADIAVKEVITSGTPTAPCGYSYPGFKGAPFVHRISPGTIVYNDFTSLEQLPNYGYIPAVLVLSAVISHPMPDIVTCDAGHKSVSADAGVPTCLVLGHSELTPLNPSEEHLPIRSLSRDKLPDLGDYLYLLPRHVCPTVNNFDSALMVTTSGDVLAVERVTARGHEQPSQGSTGSVADG